MQDLPGAVNPGRNTYAVGYLKKQPFVVYASGCNIIILKANLVWLQSITGLSCGYPNQLASCVHCADYGGKVVAVWGSSVVVFEPKLTERVVEDADSSHDFPYEWQILAVFALGATVHCVRWNYDGSLLLTSADELCLWEESSTASDKEVESADQSRGWQKVWSRDVPAPPTMIAFTMDSTMFATCGENDKLVKIWQKLPPDSNEDSSKNFSFVYINHPKPVRGLEWRQTSPVIPTGLIPNVLMTFCEDNTCKIWSHRIDREKQQQQQAQVRFFLAGVIDSQADNLLRSSMPIGQAPFIVHWLNNKSITFLQKATKAIKARSQQVSRSPSQVSLVGSSGQGGQEYLYPVKDSDMVSEGSSDPPEDVELKEFATVPVGPQTQRRSSLLPFFPSGDLFARRHSPHPVPTIASDSSDWLMVKAPTHTRMVTVGRHSLPKRLFDDLLNNWRATSDLVFAIHPQAGSLLIWTIDGLDCLPHSVRVIHASFNSCIPHVLPPAVAQSLWLETHLVTRVGLFQLSSLNAGIEEITISVKQPAKPNVEVSTKEAWFLGLYTCHSYGSVSLWSIEQTTVGSHSSISGLIHIASTGGHHSNIVSAIPHPLLPVIATSAVCTLNGGLTSGSLPVREVTLWRCDEPGLLHTIDYLSELVWMSTDNKKALEHIAWFPHVEMAHSGSELPRATILAASCGEDLVLYRVVLYDHIPPVAGEGAAAKHETVGIRAISYFGSAGLQVLATVKEVFKGGKEVLLFHVFKASSIEASSRSFSDAADDGILQRFYVVVLEDGAKTHLKMWCVEIISPDGSSDGVSASLPLTGSWKQPSVFVQPSREHIKFKRTVNTKLVSNFFLPLPSGVKVVKAAAASDTQTSYPLQFECGIDNQSPYLFSTVCSDGTILAWQCTTQTYGGFQASMAGDGTDKVPFDCSWTTFLSRNASTGHLTDGLKINCNSDLSPHSLSSPLPCALAVAHGGRLALAHHLKPPASTKVAPTALGKKEILISIWQCESSGGTQWQLDGTFTLEASSSSSQEKQQPICMQWLSLHNGLYALVTSCNALLQVHARKTLPMYGTGSESHAKFTNGTVPTQWTTVAQVPLRVYSVLESPSLVASPGCDTLLYTLQNDVRVIPLMKSVCRGENAECISVVQAIEQASAILPQYHPAVVSELMNAGRLTSVKRILLHLLQCLKTFDRQDWSVNQYRDELDIGGYDDDSYLQRPRLLSVDSNKGVVQSKQVELEAVDATDLPLLSLSTLGILSAADYDAATAAEEPNGEEEEEEGDLFVPMLTEEYQITLDTLPSEDAENIQIDLQIAEWKENHAKCLERILQHVRIPSLNVFEQVQLMALGHTLATTKLTFTKGNIQQDWSGASSSVTHRREAMDECGFRFILALTNCSSSQKFLPEGSPSLLSMSTRDFMWAFHSDAEHELVAALPCLQEDDLTWSKLSDVGIGWWLRSHDTMREVMEKLAKALFSARQEPLDAALLYMAMRKQTLMKALFKTVKNSKMQEFFGHNFTEDRWHRAALKNAFVLLTKQRFEEAAAFFLLGDSLWDAVEVCLRKLHDVQLALVITRLHEGGEGKKMYQHILKQEILGIPSDLSRNAVELTPSPDPFLRSMAHWLLGNYRESLETLILPPVANDSSDELIKLAQPDPAVFHLYFYLRNHPILLKRRHMPSAVGQQPFNISSVGSETLTALERFLVFRTAHYYINCGSPMLALDVVSKIPTCEYPSENQVYGANISDYQQPAASGNGAAPSQELAAISSGLLQEADTRADDDDDFDWGQPVAAQTTADDSDEDWSMPVSVHKKEQDSNDWDTPVSDQQTVAGSADDDFDWSKPVSFQSSKRASLAGSLDLSFDTKKEDTISVQSEVFEDKSAAQLSKEPAGNFSYGIHGLTKLTRCKLTLALLSMELANLGEHEDLVDLRHCLAQWFEGEVKVLSQLCCCYSDKEKDSISCDMTRLPTDRGMLHSLLGYTQLHSDIILNLECVRSELLLHFQEQHDVADRTRTDAESPSTVSSYKPELKAKGPERACHPWQLPLLSATLLPFTHPFSLAHQLQSLTAELVELLKMVPTPPSQVYYDSAAQAPTKEALFSSKLISTSTAVSNVLARCLTLSGTEKVTSSDIALMSDEWRPRSDSTPPKDTDSPRVTKKSGKKVTFSFDVEPPADARPNSQPSKWPGLVNWPCLLPSEGGRDPHSLCVLLVECIIPVFVALLAYSWIEKKPEWIRLLLQNKPSFNLWCDVCGGGFESKSSPKEGSIGAQGKSSRLAGMFGGGKKSRIAKAGGQGIVTDRTSEGFFLAPKAKLFSYLLPGCQSEEKASQEDEAGSDSDSDVASMEDNALTLFGWALLNLGSIRCAQNAVRNFLALTGIEILELSSQSPLLHTCYQLLESWEDGFAETMDDFKDAAPKIAARVDGSGEEDRRPSLLKHKSLLDPQNSPFVAGGPTFVHAQELWNFLLRDESILEGTFIKYIFQGKEVAEVQGTPQKPVNCILYKAKEHEGSLSSLCLNKTTPNYIAVATSRGIVELDTADAWQSSFAYMEDIALSAKTDAPSLHTKQDDDFVLVHASPRDSIGGGADGSYPPMLIPDTGATQILCRPLPGVRRLCSHPSLPYYLAGDSDGGVIMYEFGNHTPLLAPRRQGAGGAITRIHYTPQGNKFGATDTHGSLFMWQGIQSNKKDAFVRIQCHTRSTSDFSFMASSSLITAAGDSLESKNVSLFDTLLPPGRSSVVEEYICHESGAAAVAYSPNRQCIVSGGRKGDICVFDVRQHSLLRMFPAHSGPISSIIIDDAGEYFITGSTDGIIKIWDLVTLDKKCSFSKEISRTLRLFKTDSGIADMHLSADNLLYSVSAEGIVRCRAIVTGEE